MSADTSHLVALHEGLARKRAAYLADPSTLRRVWLEQAERELAAEMTFLGISEFVDFTMSDDELLDALNADV